MARKKTPQEILEDVAQGNDVSTRTERQNLLNALRERVDGWITALAARGTGPSSKETVSIVADLEQHIDELRDHG